MTGKTAVETPVVDNKIEDPVKSDKEIIAEEEKVDEPEKEVEAEKKDEEKEEPQKAEKIEPKKPTVHTKVWEENKVYLYQSSRTPQIPSISPLELKLESWLKLHGISYENVDHKAKLTSKRGTLPFIELNGEEVTDVATFQTLTEKFGKDMSSHLTQEQKNVEHAMIKMVENHLFWAIMQWRTSIADNTLKAYNIHLPTFLASKAPLALLNLYFKFNICKKVRKQVISQGFQNIEQLGKNDLDVLSAMLGDNEFLFGAEPAILDLVVYSHLAQLVMVVEEYPCPLRDFLKESCKNLVRLVNRMKDMCWGDHWELATGEKIEHNPHISKPEPVVEEKEEKKEEDKDEVKEEKVTEDKPEKVTEENPENVQEDDAAKKDEEKKESSEKKD